MHLRSDDYYEVGREKIREFARAVQDRHPAHWDDAAARALGYPGLVAPATFASSVATLAQRAMFRTVTAGYDPSQLLHVEQELHVHRPVVAGDRLMWHIAVDSLRKVEGGDIIALTTVISDQRTGPVQTVHTTLIGRQGAAADSAIEAAEAVAMQDLPVPVPEPVEESVPLPTPPHQLVLPQRTAISTREFVAGQRFSPQVYRLARGDLVNYAGVSGDNNPIHWSDNVIRHGDMDNVVAHGMLTMGLAAGYLTAQLDDPGCISEYTVQFSRMVLVDSQRPADVEFTGVVQTLDPRDRTPIIALTAQSEGQHIFGRAIAKLQPARNPSR